MRPMLCAIAAALLASHAHAGELITTADDPGATPPAAGASAAPLRATAKASVLADAPPRETAAGRCQQAPDRQPHGEVWGGVGTHGYRAGGAAVTAPVGKCANVSIAVERSEGEIGRWGR